MESPLPPTAAPIPRIRPWHTRVTVPAVLMQPHALPTRWAEFFYPSFSPFAVELVCFDLRKNAEHDLTIVFARDTGAGQDALDRELIADYRPGQPRNLDRLRAMIERAKQMAPGQGPQCLGNSQLKVVKKDVYFPGRLRAIIEERWADLGYDSLSSYLTGLIRYDFIIGGPHHYFSGKDNDPEILAALDLRTEEVHLMKKRQRILLDSIIEDAAGREMTDAERRLMLRRIAESLRANAIRSQRTARK